MKKFLTLILFTGLIGFVSAQCGHCYSSWQRCQENADIKYALHIDSMTEYADNTISCSLSHTQCCIKG